MVDHGKALAVADAVDCFFVVFFGDNSVCDPEVVRYNLTEYAIADGAVLTHESEIGPRVRASFLESL